MIVRWEQGRSVVDRLIAERRLDRVAPNRELSDLMIDQAEAHLATAEFAMHHDAPGAFQLAYDAAPKSLAAELANQGLRAKRAGAHLTLYESTRAQPHPPLGPVLDELDWMRRLAQQHGIPESEPTHCRVDRCPGLNSRCPKRFLNW
ncbi:hypothetical protein CLE01_17240 [Cryobacterium levicorallinum]|uniref:DUF222 domain-containing protein n=1 Tax=Cryobacterium levicorallinum TaxID=995038 RepID=A0ABY1EA21_9MICO|nr:hypothetical protein CLE01_17240 [Cryobacterium levicorallinum]SFH25336.1 hypothetical protein SAMN05216274_10297 [Cryobacterium levicorallinum]